MQIPVQLQQLSNCSLAFRKIGNGQPLLLVHGYPLNGLTFRHVMPEVAEHFTCYAPDLLGAGETVWDFATDFSFSAQAETLKAFVDAQGWSSYLLAGHDTGGTIARKLALIDDRVQQLALIGTEIPNHRPPWIEFFQRTSNPKRPGLFRAFMARKWFRHTRAAFKGCFWDPALIDGEFYDLLLAPAVASDRRASGLIHYLGGIDWNFVDSLRTEHAKLTMPTLLIWGAHDTVFPVERAREMATQLGNCAGFVVVPEARLFVHEEHPRVIGGILRDFFSNGSPAGVR